MSIVIKLKPLDILGHDETTTIQHLSFSSLWYAVIKYNKNIWENILPLIHIHHLEEKHKWDPNPLFHLHLFIHIFFVDFKQKLIE